MAKSDSTPATSFVAPGETLVSSIVEIRGERVILDQDLAEVYGVETKRLNQQVKRNPEKFGEKYVFQLTPGEHESLRLQSATSKIQNRIKCGCDPLASPVFVDQAAELSVQENIAKLPWLAPRDILSRALKVNLGKVIRGTFLATSCQEAIETATSSHRSRHLPGHRVRGAGSKPPNLRYPDTGPRQSELFR